MKEAIGGVSLFQIVIVFLLLFTGVMCLTINHSKAFGVKDEIINILENDALKTDQNSFEKKIGLIADYLQETGHRITGDCPDGEWIGYDREGTIVKNNASFCIRTINVSDAYKKDLENKCKNNVCHNITYADFPSMVYYDVVLFYQLDIPIISYLFNLKLYGSTKVLLGEQL